MEVGRTRRSLISESEFRASRSGKKKMQNLPLAMILSLNDKDVHPDCPNVSNPYHKCGRHCLDKIRSDNNFLDAIRSDGDREWEKKSEKKRVNPNCPYASNRYHKCAEYCLEKVSEKRQDAEKDQPGMNSNKEKKEVFTTEIGVKPACIHASNTYHVCAEYCFQTVPKKDQPGQSMTPKGFKEGEKVLSRDKSGFHPHCKDASNPNHECAESCFQSVTDRNVAEGEKPKEVLFKTNKSSVHLNRTASSRSKVTEYCFEDTHKKKHLNGDLKSNKENEIDFTAHRELIVECKNASNTYHLSDEYGFQGVPQREQPGQVIRTKSSKEGEKVMNKIESTEKPKGISFNIDERGAFPNHELVSNPYHEVVEYCFDDNPEQEHPNGALKPKEERIVVTEKRGVDVVCKYTSNPYHECTEYCFQNLPIMDQRGKALMKLEENKEASVPLERVNPQCKHKLNPYHVCAEYCLENVPNGHHPGQPIMKSKEEKKVVASPQVANLDCKNASNPHHVCDEYCFENVLETDQPKKTIKKLKEDDIVLLPSERGVSPECNFASNPYHVCAEYCFQNALERKQHGQVMKQKSLKDLKNLFSKKKLTSEHSQCEYASNPYHQCAEYCFNQNIPGSKMSDGAVVKTNERKKEKSFEPRRDDIPKYRNASDCAEYCLEEISPKNEAVEGNTATVKEKRRNSFKKNKHPIVEKISLNSQYMETSKPSEKYIKSSEGIILQDGTEKRSMNSTYVVSFNPTNTNFSSNNRISMNMKDETKYLQPAKVVDIKNPKVHIDASDLSHEWAKYCSQTKIAEDEIVEQEKKVGIGEFTTRNGKGIGFLKDNDSTNTEKVQATGGFPRSLPILFLFLLGFLLALFDWTRVIYSLVISSEKNEEAERMKHERHLDPKGI